ncbi:unnamed protein product [Candida verbasci]|uniref:Regulator of rDNA transcription 14 n=1 Tax=Candida verbasci TaxID=1227364 RepID=A0A9W4XLP5_9ASCO|nr:unnamed protein product [Candida verbasci]
MPFNSNSSKYQAENTLNKLYSSILNTNSLKPSSNNTTLSTTQILSNQLNQKHQPKVNKKKKKNVKQLEKDKKFQKFLKYNFIKNKSVRSEEEQKYVKKLIRRNINQINKASKIDDFEVESELERVKLELLNEVGPKEKRRIRNRKHIENKGNNYRDFESKGNKVNNGLTPGLAPVDYESDEEEEDAE